MSRVRSALWFSVVLGAVCGCAPGGGLPDDNGGAADLTLTAGEEAPLQLIHAPGESEVRVTPPVDGVVELTFTYNDPLVDVALRVDEAEVGEGDVVSLPASPAALALSVIYDDVEYTAEGDAAGEVELVVLALDEESGAAEVNAVIAATLVADDGSELLVDGFVEGSVGAAP